MTRRSRIRSCGQPTSVGFGRRPKVRSRQLEIERLESRSLLTVSAPWSTFLGSRGNDAVYALAADAAGNTYLGGQAGASSLLGTETASAADQPGFLVKLDPAGQLVSTLLLPVDRPTDALRVDASLDAVVLDGDEPVVAYTVAIQSDGGGVGSGSVIARLGADGRTVRATCDVEVPMPARDGFSGSMAQVTRLAAGPDGSIYFAGVVNYEIGPRIDPHAFLGRLLPDGTLGPYRLLIGNQGEEPAGLAVDAEGRVYAALATRSSDLPTSSDAFQSRPAGTYLIQTDATLQETVAATYLGGSSLEIPHGLALGPEGRVYVVGGTNSGAIGSFSPPEHLFPTTAQAIQPRMNPGFRVQDFDANNNYAHTIDGFAAVLDEGLQTLLGATYLGGTGLDEMTGVAVDPTGAVVVVGQTDALDWPTVDAVQPALSDGPVIEPIPGDPLPGVAYIGHPRDFVVMRLAPDLDRILMSTYYGGAGYDYAPRVAVDPTGAIHVAGTTLGLGFPTRSAIQPEFAGGIRYEQVGADVLPSDGVALVLAPQGVVIGVGGRASAGRSFQGPVALFQTGRPNAPAGDLSATIDWGDGTTSSGTIVPLADSPPGRFAVLGQHTYSAPGGYPTRVRVTDIQAGRSPASDIDLTNTRFSQRSARLAADPTRSGHLVAVMTDKAGADRARDGSGGGILLAESQNDGVTWSLRSIGTGSDRLPPAAGDPDAGFDANGNLHIVYTVAGGAAITLVTSPDGGATFRAAAVTLAASDVAAEQLAAATLEVYREADPGVLWISALASDVAGTRVLFARSILDAGGRPGPFEVVDQRVGSGGVVAIGPQGQVALVWQGVVPPTGDDSPIQAAIFVRVDPDGAGPLPFGDPVVVVRALGSGTNSTAALPGQTFGLAPVLAWEGADTGGETPLLYLAYTDVDRKPGPEAPAPQLDVFVVRSSDGGRSWGTPVSVSPPATTGERFLPGLAVDPTSGSVGLTWYDTRDGIGGVEIRPYAAASVDQGLSFSPGTPMAAGLSNQLLDAGDLARGGLGRSPRPLFLSSGRLLATWTDNSPALNTNPDPPGSEVAFGVLGVVQVFESPVVIRVQPIEATLGQPFRGAVASFTHPSESRAPIDFDATIAWGDGRSSPAAIEQPGGPGTPFQVIGDHTYADPGSYPLQIRVHDRKSGLDAVSASNVTHATGSQSIGTVAIDPIRPGRVFAAATDLNGLIGPGLQASVSDDDGATWRTRRLADGLDGLPLALGQPRAQFDEFGNLFLAYHGASDDGQIVVLLSTDGGDSFQVVANLVSPVPVSGPRLAVGPGPDGHQGSVWVAWGEQGDPAATGIVAAAASVTGLGQVGPFTTVAVARSAADARSRVHPAIAVGPGGQAIVTYQVFAGEGQPSQIVAQTDPDGLGPVPFSAPVVVTTTNLEQAAIPALPADARFVRAMGDLAFDRTGAATGKPVVYLVYTDTAEAGLDLTEIRLTASNDGGATWVDSIRLPADETGSQFLPSVAVDPVTGGVAVGWYEAAAGEVTASFQIALIGFRPTSYRGPIVVSPGFSDATVAGLDQAGTAIQYGNTTGLAFREGRIQAVYTDNSSELENNPDPPRFDLASAQIGVARVRRPAFAVEVPSLRVSEGQGISGPLASFADPGGGGDPTRYRATIDWGDGTPPGPGEVRLDPDGGPDQYLVAGDHRYRHAGSYTVRVTIDGPEIAGAGEGSTRVDDAPFQVAGLDPIDAVRGKAFTQSLGTIVDQNPFAAIDDYRVSVRWGDGTVSDASVSLVAAGDPATSAPARLAISATHQYDALGTFTYELQVRSGETPIATAQGTVRVKRPALQLGEVNDFDALQGISLGDIILMSFTVEGDEPIDGTLGVYRATINWQDGTVDANVAPFVTSEELTVVGRHTYLIPGVYHPTVTMQDDTGNSVTGILTVMVKPEATNLVRAVASGLVFNPFDGRFHSQLTITNGPQSVRFGPLDVLIDELPPGVEIPDPPRKTADERPLLSAGRATLYPGNSTDPIDLAFSAPPGAPITFRVRVFEAIDVPPTFEPLARSFAFIQPFGSMPSADPPTLEPLAVTTAEGTPFSGAIAILRTSTDAQPADFTATIDWGDGTTSDASLEPVAPGETRAFVVIGSHRYLNPGRYDVLARVLDSSRRLVASVPTTAHSDEDHETYRIEVDTSSLAGQSGLLALQFNAGATGLGPDASALVARFDTTGGALAGAPVRTGGASGDLESTVQIVASATLNQLVQPIRFGSRLAFVLRLTGTALAGGGQGLFGSAFALQLLAADGMTPLATTSRSGAVTEVDLEPEGSTRLRRFASDESGGQPVAEGVAAGRAFVAAAPVVVTQATIEASTGVPFRGVVASFTSGNPEAIASSYRAEIDWGDGQQSSSNQIVATAGGFTVSAEHLYARAGTYDLQVTIVDGAGGRTQARRPTTGNRTVAAREVAPMPATHLDVDGDGQLDLVWGGDPAYPGISVSSVSIARGQGDGSFLSPTSIAIGTPIGRVQPGDFNGDGRTDLAVFTDREVWVYAAQDIGNYLRVSQFSFSMLSRMVNRVAALDFDGNGTLDLVYGLATGGNGILLGNGDGSFRTDDRSRAFSGHTFAIGDLDGDGRPDLVTFTLGNLAGGILQVLINQGNGGLRPGVFRQVPDSAGFADAGLTLVDITGDGRLDVVLAARSLLLFSGTGTGDLAPSSTLLGSEAGVGQVVAADLDRDGRPDLVAGAPGVGGRFASLTTLRSLPGGQFARQSIPLGGTIGSLSIGSFDRDAFPDLLVTSAGYIAHGPDQPPTSGLTTTLLLRGTGDGGFDSARFVRPGELTGPAAIETSYRALAAADFNGDGQPDLVGLGSTPRLEGPLDAADLYLGDGQGGFLPPRRTPISTGLLGSSLAVGDLNGDGRPDLVFDLQNSRVQVLLNGAGGFSAGGVVAGAGLNGNGIAGPLALADVDGDGRLDLLARAHFYQGVAVFPGLGDGTFGPQRLIAAPSPRLDQTTAKLAVADLNGDNHPDLVLVQSNGSKGGDNRDQVLVLLNDGSGGFGTPVQMFAADYATTSIALSDLDGDGRPDLLLASQGPGGNDGRIAIYRGQPGGMFELSSTLRLDEPAIWSNLAVADLDHDGAPDVAGLFGGATFQGLAVFPNQGDGSFGGPVSVWPGGTGPGEIFGNGIAIGDFARDGLPEIMAAAADEAAIGVLENLPGPATAAARVVDPALSGQGMSPSFRVGLSAPVVVAVFQDPNTLTRPGDFTANIDWGDGSSTAGTIEALPDGPGFLVRGGHAYAAPGSFSVQTTIQDRAGRSIVVPATALVAVPAPATARDDTASIEAGSSISIAPLANDDGHGLPLAIVGFTRPQHGSVTLDGSVFRYTPAPGFTGTDQFTYQVSNGSGAQAQATIRIIVQAVDRPPVSTGELRLATVMGMTIVFDPRTAFRDPEGRPLQVIEVGPPTSGSVALEQNGQVRYTPRDGFLGTDTFTVLVADEHGGVASGQVVVTVAAAASPPVLLRIDRVVSHKRTFFVLSFRGQLDPARARDPHAYGIVSAGCDGRLGTRDDRWVSLRGIRYQAGPNRVVIDVGKCFDNHEPIQILVRGRGRFALRGTNGLLLDGDRDGLPSGNFLSLFRGSWLVTRPSTHQSPRRPSMSPPKSSPPTDFRGSP